jgi:transcriptional regulator with XRE-family HTH domain
MAELLQAIGHNIRKLRDEKGWNQTELGFRAGASPSIISLIENGKRNPSTATLAKIAEALDVDVVDLFPKGPSSSLEPTLLNGLEDERRSQHLGIWKSYLSRRVEWSEKELQMSREATFSPFRSLDTAMQWTIYVTRETDHLRTALPTEIRSYTDTDSEIVEELHALVDRFMAVVDTSVERVRAMFEEAELTDEDKEQRLKLIHGSAA